MTDRPDLELNAGLSDEEKHDLEQMIIDFHRERTADDLHHDSDKIQQQINIISERLAHLTQIFLTLEGQIKPLYETIRLTYQKSEILDQRINMLINAIRTGEPL